MLSWVINFVCFIHLDSRYNENLELEDAIHTAILTLKVSHTTKKQFWNVLTIEL